MAENVYNMLSVCPWNSDPSIIAEAILNRFGAISPIHFDEQESLL